VREPALALALQSATRSRGVPSARALRRWARASQSRPVQVTLRVVDTAEGRRLNREFRRRDYATNVLTFVYGRDRGRLAGDVVLCAPVVAREAREQGKSLAAHYAHMVVHGMLHLQGYDHVEDGEAERMERRERRILKSLGYADPYAAAPALSAVKKKASAKKPSARPA
jgi:probable rRNA maturation factor